MKKVIVGFLIGLVLCHPVKVQAAEAVFPRTHEIQVNVNEYTYDEAQLLLKIAEAEAGNQGSDGMWLVLSVIENRKRSDIWPNDVSSVIFDEGQFYTKGIGATEITPEAHEALARIERGEVAPEIIAFEKTSSNRLDTYFSKAFTYRDHQFYTLKQ